MRLAFELLLDKTSAPDGQFLRPASAQATIQVRTANQSICAG